MKLVLSEEAVDLLHSKEQQSTSRKVIDFTKDKIVKPVAISGLAAGGALANLKPTMTVKDINEG